MKRKTFTLFLIEEITANTQDRFRCIKIQSSKLLTLTQVENTSKFIATYTTLSFLLSFYVPFYSLPLKEKRLQVFSILESKILAEVLGSISTYITSNNGYKLDFKFFLLFD